MRYIYGFRNYVYFSEGSASWYPSRRERDKALAALRAEAIAHGLAESAAQHGICPIVRRVDSQRGQAFLQDLMTDNCGLGVTWYGDKDV